MNLWYVLSAAVIVCFGLLALYRSRTEKASQKAWRELWVLAGAAFVLAVYIAVTCAKAGANYASRPDVFYGLFFFAQMILLILLDRALARYKKAQGLVLLCLLLLASDIDTVGNTFTNTNLHDYKAEIVDSINNDIISQMQDAEAAGQDSVEIYIPQFPGENNWPYDIRYFGHRIADMAYEYGLTARYIRVDAVIPSADKNAELGMPVY